MRTSLAEIRGAVGPVSIFHYSLWVQYLGACSGLAGRREEFPRRGRRGSKEQPAGARATPPAGLKCLGACSEDVYLLGGAG